MSSYFDQFDKVVREIACSSKCSDDFLVELRAQESEMVRICELFAGDRDTPSAVRERIMKCIFTWRVAPAGMEDWRNSEGAKYAVVMMDCKLSREMHRIFHDIAGMKLITRYGLVLDNPRAAVERRDAHAEQKFTRQKNRRNTQ